ncbi:MAG: DUF1266 domain-containing protein [Spirochaetales bacterium]|nr:DUF1266 domain-containing protein [Spirochaetales bacterium]
MKKKLYIFIIFLLFSCLSLWCESNFSYAAWKKLSLNEKKIVLLSSLKMKQFGLDYCDFEIKNLNNEKYSSVNEFLKNNFEITDKKTFIEYLEKQEEKDKTFEYIKANSGKSFSQVLEGINDIYQYDSNDLLYYYENYSKLGKHGVEAGSISLSIFVIRLCYSVGLITKKEMISFSSPLVEKALNDYKNMEDYSAHFLADFFRTYFSMYCLLGKDYDPQDKLSYVDEFKKLLIELPADEIKFNGKNSDIYSMKLEDAVYRPSEENKPFVEYLKLNFSQDILPLQVIHKCYEQYGDLKFIKEKLSLLKPAKYDKKSIKTRVEFFEENYRDIWNSLEEYEKIAIACSFVFFELNSQFHLDIANELCFDSSTKNARKVLNESWGINANEEFLSAIKNLADDEQDSAFRKILDLYNNNPDLTEIEICEKEQYNIFGLSRFYLALQLKDKLGSHCLEAWVEAKIITLLRLGIGAGYISYKDGIKVIKLIAEKIQNNYQSFDDFMGHWVAGYCYDNIINSNSKNWCKGILDAIEDARAYIPFEELNFSGKNADKNYKMTVQDGIYKISDKAAQYMTINKLYWDYSNNNADESTLKKLIIEEEKYPEISGITFYFHYSLMRKFSSAAERVAFIESKADYINSIDNEDRDYFLKDYFHDLLNINKCEKILELYDSLPQELKINEDFYYFYGYANYLKSLKCESIIERDIYASRAITALSKLRSMGYELDTFLIYYLENSAY